MSKTGIKTEAPAAVRKWYAMIGSKGGSNGSTEAKRRAGILGARTRWGNRKPATRATSDKPTTHLRKLRTTTETRRRRSQEARRRREALDNRIGVCLPAPPAD